MSEAARLTLGLDSRPVATGAAVASRSFDDIKRNATAAAVATGSLDNSLGLLGRTLRTALGFGAAVGGVGLLTAAFGNAVRQAQAFEKQMALVNTVLDTTQMDLASLSSGVRDLFARLPVSSMEELTKGLYDIISSGIPAGEALKFLDVSARAAIAGVTSTATAVDGLTSAVNAWRGMGLTVEQAADQMFEAVNIGKMTFGELANSMGMIAPIAASYNVAMSDVIGSMAQLTLNGMDARMAAIAIRSAMVNILNPAGKLAEIAPALAKEFNAAKLETVGWTRFLQEFFTVTKGNKDLLNALFTDVQGKVGVFSTLADGGERAAEMVSRVANASGAANTATQKLLDTSSALNQTLKNKLSLAFIDLGNKMLPLVNKALEVALVLVQQLTNNLAGLTAIGLAFMGRFIGPMIQRMAAYVAVQATMYRQAQAGNAVILGSAEAERQKAVAIDRAAQATARAERAKLAELNLTRQAIVETRKQTLAELELARAREASLNSLFNRAKPTGALRDPATGRFANRSDLGMDRIRAQEAQGAAVTRLATLGAQQASVNKLLAAQTSAVAVAQTAATRSSILLARATAATTLSARAGAVAMTAFRGVVTFLGGPVGAAITLGLTAIGTAFSILAGKAREARDAVTEVKQKLEGKSAEELGGYIAMLEQRQTVLRNSISSGSFAGDERELGRRAQLLRATQAQIAANERLIETLKEAQRAATPAAGRGNAITITAAAPASPGDGTGTFTDEAVRAVEDLRKLQDAANAMLFEARDPTELELMAQRIEVLKREASSGSIALYNSAEAIQRYKDTLDAAFNSARETQVKKVTRSIADNLAAARALNAATRRGEDAVRDYHAARELQADLDELYAQKLAPALQADLEAQIRLTHQFTRETEALREAQEQRAEQEKRAREQAEDDARRRAEDAAERAREPFVNAVRGIQQAFSDFFADTLAGGIKTFRDLGEAIKGIFIRMVAELMAMRLMEKLTQLMTPKANVLAGVASMTLPVAPDMIAGAMNRTPSAASGAGGLFSLKAIGGAMPVIVMGLAGAAMAGTLGGNAGRGAALGAVAGGVAGGLGAAKIGAALGTSIAPGVGTIVGGIIGGIVGAFSGAAAKRKREAAERKAREDFKRQAEQFAANTMPGQGQYATALRTLSEQFNELRKQAEKLKVDITAATSAFLAARAKLVRDFEQGLEGQIADLTGGTNLTAFQRIVDGYREMVNDAERLGSATGASRARDLVILQIEQFMRALSASDVATVLPQLTAMFPDFASEIVALANAIQTGVGLITRASQGQVDAFRDELRVRELMARGQNKQAEELRLRIAQERELMEARKSGFGDDIINELRRIQQLELEALRRRSSAMSGSLNVASGYDLTSAQTAAGLFVNPATVAVPAGAPGDTYVVSGDITIDAKDKSPDELFALLLSAAKKKSQAQFGTTARWSEVT